VHMTRSSARGSIFFPGTVSSKRDLTWACWDSVPGIRRGVVVVIDSLDVLFLMRGFLFGDGSVAQKTQALLSSGYKVCAPS